jgi:uncharacterized protein YbjT (DUF2867 family)
MTRILVLGASGLIGHSIATDLIRRGFPAIAAARRFTEAQRRGFGAAARETPIVDLGGEVLAQFVRESAADIVVNCLGVLQDAPGESTQDVHAAFIERLIAALRAAGRSVLLVHLSIPGGPAEDSTDFARSKRLGERRIVESGLPYVVLRPGFVFAPAAYGGSALLRALAILPVELPARERSRSFSYVAIEDIAETVARLAQDWPAQKPLAAFWDLMHPQPCTVGDVVAQLRHWLGGPAASRVPVPSFLLGLGARAGDLAARLGWRPPIRSTALAEMRRGVAGDPAPWLEATRIVPRSLEDVLAARPATVQERWFARLYLLKALVIGGLSVFWCVSGLIALTVAYPAAVAILTAHAVPLWLAHPATIVTSLIDIAIGVAIAVQRSARAGLVAGIAVSLFYMAGATVLTPELWLDPVGALVKTGPAIILMLVGLAILDDR